MDDDLDKVREPASMNDPSELSLQKTIAEIEKLRQETSQLQREATTAKKQHRLEQIKAYAGMTTTMVAILGLFITLWAHLLSNEADRVRRESEGFQSALRQYGETNDTARLAAAASLETYMRRPPADRQAQVVQLHVTALELEKSESVRAQLIGALIRNPSKQTVAALRERNIALQDELKDLLKAWSLGFDRWERTESDGPEIHKSANRLEENGKALIGVLNSLYQKDGEVRGIDLSRTIFLMPTIHGENPETRQYGYDQRFVIQFMPGIKFFDVDFSDAKLSWLFFKDCNFTDVKLDRAKLVNTVFNTCFFDGTTSISDYIWALKRPHKSGLFSFQISAGPTFAHCKINVKTLHPATLDDILSDGGRSLKIADSTWNIASSPNDLPKRFKLSKTRDTTGSFQAGSGGWEATVRARLFH